jgi:hypothetical protein
MQSQSSDALSPESQQLSQSTEGYVLSHSLSLFSLSLSLSLSHLHSPLCDVTMKFVNYVISFVLSLIPALVETPCSRSCQTR